MPNDWLMRGLREIGIAPGDVVLVHSSMKGLGYVDGGAEAVIDALLLAVGDDGTVLFPTLTGSKADGPDAPPAIDLLHTPCWTGLIPETARRRSVARRSLHPTHSVVALGANTEQWAAGHEHGQSPCDGASPYAHLMQRGGKILLLGGVDHNSNTSMHCIEELARSPYHLQDEMTPGTVKMPNGETITVTNRLHRWQNRYSQLNLERDFNRAAKPLIAEGVQRMVRIGNTESTLIDARGMREVLIPLLERDPLFLLDPAS